MLNEEKLKKALEPFVKEMKTTLPQNADKELWIQMWVNMEWLTNAMIAIDPEAEKRIREFTENFNRGMLE